MIAPWLLYATAMGCLIAFVSLLLERIARWRTRPTRWMWLAAIIAIVALPIGLNLFRHAPVPHFRGAFALVDAVPARSRSLDARLIVLWLIASSLVAARVAGTALALRRRRKTWLPANLHGERVLLADELGPAVIGWTRPVTVIPRWAFTLDERSRELMLQHEAEHARARDPYLRMIALLALVVMPWNPAIWWSMRRLRLAVEIDCDRRIIARGVDTRQYAALLLAVGERIATTPFAWATAFAGPRSSLETRIIVMSSSPRSSRVAITAAGTAVAALIAVACASPVPDSVVPPPAPTVAAALASAKSAKVTRDSVVIIDCEIGSACAAMPEGNVVFRKGRRDACEAGAECTDKAVSVITGDSIRTAADTIYVFRVRNKSESGDVEARVAPLHDEVRLTNEPAAATVYCTAEQAVQAKRDRDAGKRFSRRCP